MKIKIKTFSENVKIPTKTHSTDVGFDLYLPEDIEIKSLETAVVGMKVGFQIPEGYAGFFIPRSSIAAKGLISQMAATDAGYTGECHFILTNCSPKTILLKKDQRVVSFICLKSECQDLEVVTEFGQSERGLARLGSSGQ